MYDELLDYAEKRMGKVSMAALPSLSADWLPGILAEFLSLYPGIKIQLHVVAGYGVLGDEAKA